MSRIKLILIAALVVILITAWIISSQVAPNSPLVFSNPLITGGGDPDDPPTLDSPVFVHPLQIEYLRQQDYPGSPIQVEQTLAPGSNYQQFVVSYQSQGLKQFALLTIPNGATPKSGWPAIVFNHGYIAPEIYRTTLRYTDYVAGFARQGYIVLKPDYRGHDNSEGEATGGYGTPDYTIDVLNAFTSLAQDSRVDPQKIGMWGHSMGGWITQRAMVINPDIKAGVIWSGVVGSYPDLYQEWWNKRPSSSEQSAIVNHHRQRTRQYINSLLDQDFADSISATSFLSDLSGPIQLHHARGDQSVPFQLSQLFYQKLEPISPDSRLYLYPGDNHNLTTNFSLAMQRSVEFFDQHLKAN